jgi:hypothetical protein
MNPANDFRKLRRLLGPAVWLLILLSAYTPEGWTGDSEVYAAGGNVIGDEELADVLQVTPGIIARWRCRLRKAELLEWLVKPGVGRVFIIRAVNTVIGPQLRAQAQSANPVEAKKRSELEAAQGWTN